MPLELSGDRFSVIYRLHGAPADAAARAEDICIEQTIEFPADLVTDDAIRDQIFGRVEQLTAVADELTEVEISYATECAGAELPQLLNVAFGNISLKPGIRLERIKLSPALAASFPGPRFGRQGLRDLLEVPARPLLCTAIKPMGLPLEDLAAQAFAFAKGGMDLIKDDHGFSNQPYASFEGRVRACQAAVTRANADTGGTARYAPSVSGPADQTLARARFAQEIGCGALLVAPGLIGLDTMRQLAADDTIALPILSHPALQGSFVVDPHSGMSHHAVFGQLNRLAGADAVIFPHFGGRFSFSEDECRDLAAGTDCDMQGLAPIFPVPAGGMSLGRVAEIVDFYRRDVMLLIGGDLHRHGPDLAANCRQFRELVEG